MFITEKYFFKKLTETLNKLPSHTILTTSQLHKGMLIYYVKLKSMHLNQYYSEHFIPVNSSLNPM